MPVVRNLKSVTIEFEDGTIDTFVLPEGTGFLRESYTYEPKKGDHKGLSKWGDQLRVYEIFWAEKVVPT